MARILAYGGLFAIGQAAGSAQHYAWWYYLGLGCLWLLVAAGIDLFQELRR